MSKLPPFFAIVWKLTEEEVKWAVLQREWLKAYKIRRKYEKDKSFSSKARFRWA